MSDLIDRQAAIDALKDMYHAAEKWGEETSDDVIKARAESCMASLIEMKLRIENLPSAQQERTCVNCGRTVNNGGWYADGRTRCPIEEHYALPKDGYCHLWEKRNVTDDDYPERRTR